LDRKRREPGWSHNVEKKRCRPRLDYGSQKKGEERMKVIKKKGSGVNETEKRGDLRWARKEETTAPLR